MIDKLLSGLITSLLVFVLGLWWQNRKLKQKLKGVSLLLFLEVNDHLYWLSNLNSLSAEFLLKAEFPEWDKNRHFLAANIPFQKFTCVLKHYRSMRAVKNMLKSASGKIPGEFLNKYIANAEAAHQILFNLAGLTKNDVVEYNLHKTKRKPKKSKQLSSQNQ